MNQHSLPLQRWHALSGPRAIRARWVAALQSHIGVHHRRWSPGASHAAVDQWIVARLQQVTVIPDARIALLRIEGSNHEELVWERTVEGIDDWRRWAPHALSCLPIGQAWRVIMVHYGEALDHALHMPVAV